jgi:predicted Zn-dependent protease with MMP-like domain
VRRCDAQADRRRFEAHVSAAIDAIPEEFARYLGNVVIRVAERPSATLLRSVGLDPCEDTLYGIYEGTALSERSADFAGQPPDRITIFRQPILQVCRSERDVRAEIETTIVHEIAHFFGLEEDLVRRLGY